MPLPSRSQRAVPSRSQRATPTRQIARLRSLTRDLGRTLHRLDWSTLDTKTRQRLALFLLPLYSALSLTMQITRSPHNNTEKVLMKRASLLTDDEPSLLDDLPIFRRPRDP